MQNKLKPLTRIKKVHFGRTRLKSMFFEIFSSGGSLKETRSEEIFFKNVDFSL